jgi:hypothetical protein
VIKFKPELGCNSVVGSEREHLTTVGSMRFKILIRLVFLASGSSLEIYENKGKLH